MKQYFYNAFIYTSLTLLPTKALGIKIFALYGVNCEVTAGAIIYVDDDIVKTIGFDGKIHTTSIDTTHTVAMYDVIQNPFSSFNHSPLQQLYSTITVDIDSSGFEGYAVDFFDELVFFLDLQGKVRTTDIKRITSIRSPQKNFHHINPKPAPLKLEPPSGKETCAPQTNATATSSTARLTANRVLNDKLQLHSFWANRSEGYRKLRNLEERTYFYPKPILYDLTTRLGISDVTHRHDLGPLPPTMTQMWESFPIYLEFANAEPYRLQTSTTLGTNTIPKTPTLHRIGIIKSEFKSHLLHGIFIANLNGFSAGSSIYSNFFAEKKIRHKVWMDHTFNHITLLGFDLGSYTVSYGYYFPQIAYGQNQEFREFRPNNSSTVWRLGWQNYNLKIDGLFFYSNYSADIDQPSENYILRRIHREDTFAFYSHNFLPRKVKSNLKIFRLNSDYKFSGDVLVRFGLLLGQSKVVETSQRTDTDSESVTISDLNFNSTVKQTFNMFQKGISLSLRKDLGQWIGLRFETIYENRQIEGGFHFSGSERDDDAKYDLTTLVTSMELFL